MKLILGLGLQVLNLSIFHTFIICLKNVIGCTLLFGQKSVFISLVFGNYVVPTSLIFFICSSLQHLNTYYLPMGGVIFLSLKAL